MNATDRRTWNISEIAKATGLKRYVIATLIKANRIPCAEFGNHTLIGEGGLARLIPVLARYPGVDPSFVEKL